MKNKKVIIISLIVGIPIVLVILGVLLYSQFLLLHAQSKKDLIGTRCNSSLEPNGRNSCESVIWGISIKNPELVCTSIAQPGSNGLIPPGSSGTCQYR